MLQKLRNFMKKPSLRRLAAPGLRKYWALGLVCVLLLLCVLLAPGGAAPEPVPASTEAADTVPATEPPAPPAPAGLTALDLELLPEESVAGLCRDGDGAAAILIRWDFDARVWRSRLVLLDPKTAAVKSETALEPLGDIDAFGLPELTETELHFVDPESERCVVFARSGRFLGLRDHPVMDRAHLGWRNVLLRDDCFYKTAKWAEFSRSDSGRLNRAVAFYDEKDRIHLVDEPYDLIRDAEGHRLLTLRFDEDGAGELALLDLDAALCLDRLALAPGENAEALLGPDWVLLSLSPVGEGSDKGRLCFWYPDAEKQRPIETELLTEQALADGIEVLRQGLEAQGLLLCLDEAPAPEQTPTTGLPVYESRCETGASLFGQYWILTALDGFVQKLPAGMLRELTAVPGSEPTEADGLRVYIVRSIPGDASAFASAWMEPALVCFATEEFSPTHLAHEFMHIFDLRLSHSLAGRGRDLEGEWAALSPDWAYEPELSQAQRDELEPYFVSWYARTNSFEDRAETFQTLFDSEEPVAEQWWYADKPGVRAKARWLTEALREAFPSVQAVEQAAWEKLPPEEAG